MIEVSENTRFENSGNEIQGMGKAARIVLLKRLYGSAMAQVSKCMTEALTAPDALAANMPPSPNVALLRVMYSDALSLAAGDLTSTLALSLGLSLGFTAAETREVLELKFRLPVKLAETPEDGGSYMAMLLLNEVEKVMGRLRTIKCEIHKKDD